MRLSEPPYRGRLRRVAALFTLLDELPDGQLKATMRGMLATLADVLHRGDDIAFTIGRLHDAIARRRLQDPMTRFEAELRTLRRRRTATVQPQKTREHTPVA
jgi:hypothetical protein